MSQLLPTAFHHHFCTPASKELLKITLQSLEVLVKKLGQKMIRGTAVL
jgi:hypothetical protein